MINNPFTLVWDGLWTMVERNSILMSNVRKGNRIKFEEQDELKRMISDGDLPELSLLSSGAEINIMNSSNTSSCNRKYTWGIATGELQINPFYNTLSWELFRSMIDWDCILCPLIWPEDSNPEWHFVEVVNIMSVEEGNLLISENRGIRGWAGLWTIEVRMCFRTEDLRLPLET